MKLYFKLVFLFIGYFYFSIIGLSQQRIVAPGKTYFQGDQALVVNRFSDGKYYLTYTLPFNYDENGTSVQDFLYFSIKDGNGMPLDEDSCLYLDVDFITNNTASFIKRKFYKNGATDVLFGIQKAIEFLEYNTDISPKFTELYLNSEFHSNDNDEFPLVVGVDTVNASYRYCEFAFGRVGKKYRAGRIGEELRLFEDIPYTMFDIVAHEFGHFISRMSHGEYNYEKEYGALNESFSDILAAYLTHYYNLNGSSKYGEKWLHGEYNSSEGNKEFRRSLKNPSERGHPKVYNDVARGWKNTNVTCWAGNDFCGVHINSGVSNFFFYLLSEGTDEAVRVNVLDTPYKVNGIGMDDAFQVFYKTWTLEAYNNIDFHSFANSTVSVAKDIFPNQGEKVQSVINAWHAVGINLTEEHPIVLDFTIVQPTCTSNGQVTAIDLTGNPNLDFKWSYHDEIIPGPTIFGVPSGDYTVTATDNSSGYSTTSTVQLLDQISFSSHLGTIPNADCLVPTGKVVLTVKDKSTDQSPSMLKIKWLDEIGNGIFIQDKAPAVWAGLAPGRYSVEIEDLDTECTEVLPFTIETKPIDIEIEGGGYRPFCQDKLPPHIKLYPFVKDCPSCEVVDWDTTDGIILEEASDLSEITVAVQNATYSLTMKDENGCSETVFTSIQVDERDCTECADDNLEFISFTGVDPCKGFIVNVLQPIDPNEIIGPEGYGDPNWISINDEVPYTVLFENDPEFAMADARRIEIIHYFDDKANPATFRLSDFGFANLSFTVPANRSFYQARLDARDSLGVYVDVVAGIDVVNNKAFWILEAIDPSTGQPPLDPDVGMLPINDSLSHRGEGYVNFSLHSIATAITGDTLLGQATILFDENEPIETNIHYNVIDAVAPTSQIDSLPDLIDTTAFTISWIGADDPGGSGLKVYNLYVAENAGPYLLYQSNLIDTSLVFKGRKGDTYSFYTRAIDNTGNIEKPKPGVSVTIKDDLLLAAKVILQGPYDGGEQLMRDDLRVQGKIPLLEPYLDFGYVTATGLERIDTSVLLNIGPDAIIDWIFVELRNAKDYSFVEATRSALLQRDGDIVDLDGISPVIFFNLKPDEYFVVIRHRNHLGIRSSQPVSLSSIATSYDFTAVLSQAAGTTPLHDLGNGKFGLYAGNANFDAQINAVDKNTFWRVQNGQPYVYGISIADFNMDGTVNAVDKNSYWRINNSIAEQIE